jgi:hypothetical protein
MSEVILLLAIYGLALIIKETNGPFNIIGRLRNYILRNKYLGVEFYNWLECPICHGVACGLIIYLLFYFKLLFIIWGLAGSGFLYLVSRVLNANKEI